MKRKILSLALALALCFGLTVPSFAADLSGLDANAQKAYYDVLAAEISKYGIVTRGGGVGLEYAALEDMDANGIPELIMVRYAETGVLNGIAYLSVWTIQDGKAVQTVNDEISSSGEYSESSLFLVRQSGRTAVCHSLEWYVRDFLDNAGEITFSLYYADGSVKAFDSDETWTAANSIRLYGGGGMWLHDDKAAEALKQVQIVLTDAVKPNPAPAAGTYGPYTITGVMYDGRPYKVSFSAAKVEQKTVQIREYYDIGGDYSSYQNQAVTLVTIRPDTNVTVSSSYSDGVPVEVGNADGNNKYTKLVFGVVQYIHNGVGKQSFEWDLTTDCVKLDHYLIYEDATAYTNGGFTDVKTGDYYADAVKWAVDKKITSGTSAATFSPDNTCTVAQILTFLWRANGSPEPTGHNPFTDISNSDYYYKAAIWAANKGLVAGNKFHPNAACTRSMVVTYLWKLAGSPSMNAAEGYGPQTISGNYEGQLCSIRFSTAKVEEITITEEVAIFGETGLWDDIAGYRDESRKVTLITAQAGSTFTFNGLPDTLWYGYSEENGKYKMQLSQYCEPVYPGSVENVYNEPFENADAFMLGQLFDENGNSYMLKIVSDSANTGFTDVPSNAAYAQAVAWAVSQEITSGTSNTAFSPNATCTRGEIVTFLHRAMGK